MKSGFLLGGGGGKKTAKKSPQAPTEVHRDEVDEKENDNERDRLAEVNSQLREIKTEMESAERNGFGPNDEHDGPFIPEWCQLQHRWDRAVQEWVAITEERRVATVVEVMKEHYPAMFVEVECPLCFEITKRSDEVDDSSSDASTLVAELPCCGKRTCKDCAGKSMSRSTCCPFCRFDFDKYSSRPANWRRHFQDLIDRNVNRQHAHYALGKIYFQEQTQAQEAARHLRIAADLGNTTARHILAILYFEGRGVEMSIEEGHRLSLLAAEGGGMPGTPFNVANSASDDDEAVIWMTFAASEGSFKSQNMLGRWYSQGERGLVRSMDMATYWMRKAAERGSSDSQLELSSMLQFCAAEKYGPRGKSRGHNPWPQILYWCRKGAYRGEFPLGFPAFEGARLLASFEGIVSSDCSHCGKKKGHCPGGKLMPCQRCKAAFYCDLKCWAKDCKEGTHKVDCIPCACSNLNQITS